MNKYYLYYTGRYGDPVYIKAAESVPGNPEFDEAKLQFTTDKSKALKFPTAVSVDSYGLYNLFSREEIVEKKWYVEFTVDGTTYYHGAGDLTLGGGSYTPQNGYSTRQKAVAAVPNVFKGHMEGSVSCVSVVEK